MTTALEACQDYARRYNGARGRWFGDRPNVTEADSDEYTRLRGPEVLYGTLHRAARISLGDGSPLVEGLKRAYEQSRLENRPREYKAAGSWMGQSDATPEVTDDREAEIARLKAELAALEGN